MQAEQQPPQCHAVDQTHLYEHGLLAQFEQLGPVPTQASVQLTAVVALGRAALRVRRKNVAHGGREHRL
ncbi:hypothetical protein DMA15_00360 [Streptomyces sp. WAC 01529]|nr:hypothetical protein DMA15_00360 [Streptomyces sp. WAC 01529]